MAEEVDGLGRFLSPAGLTSLHRAHRVLVIDPDPVTRRSYELTLGGSGYQVSVSGTAEEGLEHLGRQPCDLVVSDMALPDLDALSLTTMLRQCNATRELPIILVSAQACTQDRVKALEAGADDVLTKPLDPEELVARVAARIARAKRNTELERLSTRDAVTGLLNRNALVQEVTRELRRTARTGSPLSLVMVDLDDFKAVNDRYGHLVGDEALCRVALKLETAVRTTDRVARFGGDEFVIVLADTDETQLEELLDRLKQSWRQHPPLVPLAARPIMASFGGATAEPGRTLETLLYAADVRMYQDKRRYSDLCRGDESER